MDRQRLAVYPVARRGIYNLHLENFSVCCLGVEPVLCRSRVLELGHVDGGGVAAQ
jgi:hypothetical protein